MHSTKSRNGKQTRRFSIRFLIEGIPYAVVPLTDIHPDVATKAYRIQKLDAEGHATEVYDVRLSPEGFIECSCLGNLRWRHCKHQETLQAAGMLPATFFRKS